MTTIQIFALIVLPVMIAAAGWLAVLLHERSLRNTER